MDFGEYLKTFTEAAGQANSILNPQRPPTPATANLNARQPNWTPLAIGGAALLLVLVLVLALSGRRS